MDESEGRVHCPFLLPDIEKAVERLKAAREKGEHVMVYRDYDVDGTMGGVILVKGLQRYGLNNVGHLAPNRFKHGYGLHKELIDQIASQRLYADRHSGLWDYRR